MEHALLGLTGLVGLGILAQWIAWRIHLPSILLLLIFGGLVGPVTGWISPNELLGQSLIPFVSLSVAVILFEGGLSLNIRDLLKVGQVIRNLVTIGALITFVLISIAARTILGLDLSLAILLGAILVVTGPTVVIPLLRQIRPSGDVGTILRWEGIVIDPVGATLAVLVFEAIQASGFQAAAAAIVIGILKTIMIGLVLGIAAGFLIQLLLRYHLLPDHLENPVTLMAVLGFFAASNLLQHESGFLTVTVFGVFLASQSKVSVDHIIEFKENLQVLLLGILFILLAARLEPTVFDRTNLALTGAFLFALIFVIRPAAALISSWRSHLSWKERLFLCWMAPRGIVAASVAAIFALRLSEGGFVGAEQLVPVTFSVIIGTITVYGLTALPLARWMGVAEPDQNGVLFVGGHAFSRALALALKQKGVPVVVADSNWSNISSARMAGLATYYGNVLSRRALDEIDLEGIGSLVACTQNDEVNSLCCLHFEEVFGKAGVFQLPFGAPSGGNRDSHSQKLHGRLLFSKELHFKRLRDVFSAGGRIVTTQLTEEFDIEKLQSYQNFRGVPLFVIRANGKIRPVLQDGSLHVVSGDKVVSLLPSEEGTES